MHVQLALPLLYTSEFLSDRTNELFEGFQITQNEHVP